MDDVLHARPRLAVEQQDPLDGGGLGVGRLSEELAELGPKRALLDHEPAGLELDPVPARELGIGHELLESLVEAGRSRAPDVGAAALPADDLAALFEPS